MRYGSEHKSETKSRILKLAAQEIRLKGPDKASVAEIMASAGLTHGGFYAHFDSKDALVAEAVDVMFADMQRRTSALDKAMPGGAADPSCALRAFLASYISPEHRDRPDQGCPLPAMSADMARSSGAAKARFAMGLEKLTSRVETMLANVGNMSPSSEARAVVAQMVGAVALARAVGKGTTSDAILSDTLNSLQARLGL
jgi:TetR/AcrR family transcriptional repressor of nem operon